MDARWTRRRTDSGASAPVLSAFGEDGGTLRVVGHPGDVRSGQHQVGVGGTVGGHPGEAGEHAGHVLEPIPPADLHDEPRLRRRRRSVGDESRAGSDSPDRPVTTCEGDGALGRDPIDQAHRREDGIDGRRIQVAVLGREGVDRGRDDHDSVAVDPLRHVLRPREHEGVGTFEVGPEERPGLVRQLVAAVASDVAAPHDPHPRCPDALDHARRLRVVQHHDVAGIDPGEEVREVRGQDAFERGVLGGTERPVIPRIAVQAVVQTLRDGEELRLTIEDEPPVLDAGAPPIGEQGLEHLGDTAAVRRRVHVPDRAVPERRGGRAPRPRACGRRAPGPGSPPAARGERPSLRPLPPGHPAPSAATADPPARPRPGSTAEPVGDGGGTFASAPAATDGPCSSRRSVR